MAEILQSLGTFLSQNSGEFISALAGALGGATAAAWIQHATEKRKERKNQHGAVIRAQMALITQLNVLASFRFRKLDPLREDRERDRKITLLHLPRNCLEVDFESIAFLIEKADANLLLQVQVAERAYHSAIDAIDVRNHAYRELHAESEVLGGNIDEGEFLVRADARKMRLLKDYTDALYTSTDHAEKLCHEAVAKLKEAGRKNFPGQKFLSASTDKPSSEQVKPTSK